jgi:hypothetical protein
MNFKFIAIVFAFVFALFVSGCAQTSEANAPDPKASVAQPAAPSAAPEPAPNTNIKKFGEVKTYDDGVSISVSKPANFKPNEYAIGAVPGQKYVVYTVVLTNGTKEVFQPMTFGTVSSGGAEAKSIIDIGNPIGDIGQVPTTAILPGKTVKWLEAYSLADPKTVTYQIAPAFKYEKAIFTNIPQ